MTVVTQSHSCGEGTIWLGFGVTSIFLWDLFEKGKPKVKIVVLGNNGFWRVCPAF